ncbi:hypothetical protein B5M47_03620 [candidate division CPR3 bacterium 4484_211]|uniref:Uncharacterized protein n=1 Tax=candidate division CPR3 bacterium 4484_211 TaxID=1968527 RepID=A0A1W9NXA0_UNCC3|nr:MAG: hypothetical protein B5M47_03620 [candidate division CPR3 bacterium 4484_211]
MATVSDLNQQLGYLVELAIISPKRRDLYLKAIPKLTVEEKLSFSLDLWHLLLMKMEGEVQQKMEEEIRELAENPDKVYYKKNFQKIPDEVLRGLIRERMEIRDEDEIRRIRDVLKGLESKLEIITKSASEAREVIQSHVK